MNSLTASRCHIKAYQDAANQPQSEYIKDETTTTWYTHFGGWLAASWYALMWQRDGVSEFMCASHYLEV